MNYVAGIFAVKRETAVLNFDDAYTKQLSTLEYLFLIFNVNNEAS